MSPLGCMLALLCMIAINNGTFGSFALSPALGANLCNRAVLFVERADSRGEPLRYVLIEARNRALIRGKSHTALQYQ
ncbi:MAG: hypothetical protein QXN56_06370 [Candidatus Hadarchaeum sp.]